MTCMPWSWCARMGMALLLVAALVAMSSAAQQGGLTAWAGAPPAGQNHLLWAITLDDPATLRLLLSEGSQPDTPFAAGATPLLVAVAGENPQLVRILLRAGADPNRPGPLGFSPLHSAAMLGRTEMIRALLAAGANVECATRRGETPLVLAARNGQADAVTVLLKAAAAVDPPGSAYRVLVEAAEELEASPELFGRLIAAGADVNAPDAEGVTPLEAARRAGREDLVMILQQYGAAGTSSRVRGS